MSSNNLIAFDFPLKIIDNQASELDGKWGEALRSTASASAHKEYIKALQENNDFKLLNISQKKQVLDAAYETIKNVKIKNGYIDEKEYVHVIKNAPIVSIDLLIFNHLGELLVGERNNEPAKNSLFVPGSRIRKNEDTRRAIKRIADEELGVAINSSNFKLLGAYNHLYNNNFKNDKFSTHYICFAYSLTLDKPMNPITDSQHDKFYWLSTEDIITNPRVHMYVKNYFHPTPWNKIT